MRSFVNITENFRNYINSLNKINSENSSLRLDPSQTLVSTKKRTCVQNFFGWFIHIITFTLVSRNRELDMATQRFLEEAENLNKISQLASEEKDLLLRGITNLTHVIKRNAGSYLSKVNGILDTVKKIEGVSKDSFSNEHIAENSTSSPIKFDTATEIASPTTPPLMSPVKVEDMQINPKQALINEFFKTFQKNDFEDHKDWILSEANQKFFLEFDLSDYESFVKAEVVLINLFSALEKCSENKRAQEMFIQCTDLLFNRFQQPLSQNSALKNNVYHYLSEEQAKKLPLEEYTAPMALFLDDRLGMCKDSILMMQKYFELTFSEAEECKKMQVFSKGYLQEITQKEIEHYFKDLLVLLNDYNPDYTKKIISKFLDITNSPSIDTHFSLLIKNCSNSKVRQLFIDFLKASTNINHISTLIRRLLETDHQEIILPTLEALEIQPWKLWIFLAKNSTFDKNCLFKKNPELTNLMERFSEDSAEQILESLSQFFNSSHIDLLKDVPDSSRIIDSILDGIRKLTPPQRMRHLSFMSLGEIFAVLKDPKLREEMKRLNIQNSASEETVNKFKLVLEGLKNDLSEDSKEYKSFKDFGESLICKALFPKDDSKPKKEPILYDARKMEIFNKAKKAIGALLPFSPRRFKEPFRSGN